MTRSHFATIASIIAAIPEDKLRDRVAWIFATKLKDTNPRFDRARFLSACKVNP